MATPSSASVSSTSGSVSSTPLVLNGGGSGSFTALLRAISATDGPFVDYRSSDVIAELRKQRMQILQRKRSSTSTTPGYDNS
jgi:hypothetical protein